MVATLTVRGEVDTGVGAGGGGGPGSSPVPPPNLFKKRVGDVAGGPRVSLVPQPRWRGLLWSLLRAGVAAVAGRRAPSERDASNSGPPASPHAPTLAWSCVRSHMAVSVAGTWPPVVALYSFHDDESPTADVMLPPIAVLPRKVAVEVGRLHCPASAVDITCVAWAPFLADAVAVGTRSGVWFWQLSQFAAAPSEGDKPQRKRPGASSPAVRVELPPGFAPVASIAWSPCGRFLAVASPNKSSVCLWDMLSNVTSLLCIPVLQYLDVAFRAGLDILAWSPCGQFLFASTTEASFCLWNVASQQCWCYENLTGNVLSAVWSPASTCMLISTAGSADLMSLWVGSIKLGSDVMDVSPEGPLVVDARVNVVEDLVAHCATMDPAHYSPTLIAWDAGDLRLAVLIAPNADAEPGATHVIALYQCGTADDGTVDCSIKGFLRPSPQCEGVPTSLQFAPVPPGPGCPALLSAVYNNMVQMWPCACTGGLDGKFLTQ